MKSIKFAKVVSIIVAVVALAVIAGWFFDIELLRTVIPGAIAMRFLTALAFLGVSLLLYSLVKLKEEKQEKRENLIFIFLLMLGSFLIVFFMIIAFFNVLGVRFNIEEMINYNYLDHSQTFPVLIPSLSTMFLFILISLAGFMNIFCMFCSQKVLKLFGVIISLVSLSVLIGYLLNIPAMYFAIQGVSNAMAIHTGVLFLIIGIAFFMLGNNNNNNNTFVTQYTIKQKLMIGFFVLIALMIMMGSITSIIIRENNINFKLIKEVEAPLQVMVEEVIGYDAMLTGSAHEALLHTEIGDYSRLREHKSYYDEVGIKLDSLLKYDARELLNSSKRGTGDKELVYGYLAELDRINLALVDLELSAFSAMEKGDSETARNLIVTNQYEAYKAELFKVYQNWVEEEERITSLYEQKTLKNLQYILWANMIFGLLVILVGILLARFITHSVVRPLEKLDKVAKEISAGNLDVKISSESRGMPGIIGDIANSYSILLESSHLALQTLVQSKINKTAPGGKASVISSKDAVMTLEPPTWNFTSANLATLKMFRVANEKQFVSMQPWQLSPKYQPDGQLSSVKAKKMIEKAMKEGTNFFEWTHRRYNGQEFPATVLLTSVEMAGRRYLQAIVTDKSRGK